MEEFLQGNDEASFRDSVEKLSLLIKPKYPRKDFSGVDEAPSLTKSILKDLGL